MRLCCMLIMLSQPATAERLIESNQKPATAERLKFIVGRRPCARETGGGETQSEKPTTIKSRRSDFRHSYRLYPCYLMSPPCEPSSTSLYIFSFFANVAGTLNNSGPTNQQRERREHTKNESERQRTYRAMPRGTKCSQTSKCGKSAASREDIAT